MPLSTQVVEMGSGELNDADNPAMYKHPIQEGAGGGGRGDGGVGGVGERRKYSQLLHSTETLR